LSELVEIAIALAVAFGAIWLPGALVIKAAKLVRPHRPAEPSRAFFNAGPAQDL
jgi:hypothetical protein